MFFYYISLKNPCHETRTETKNKIVQNNCCRFVALKQVLIFTVYLRIFAGQAARRKQPTHNDCTLEVAILLINFISNKRQ